MESTFTAKGEWEFVFYGPNQKLKDYISLHFPGDGKRAWELIGFINDTWPECHQFLRGDVKDKIIKED